MVDRDLNFVSALSLVYSKQVLAESVTDFGLLAEVRCCRLGGLLILEVVREHPAAKTIWNEIPPARNILRSQGSQGNAGRAFLDAVAYGPKGGVADGYTRQKDELGIGEGLSISLVNNWNTLPYSLATYSICPSSRTRRSSSPVGVLMKSA